MNQILQKVQLEELEKLYIFLARLNNVEVKRSQLFEISRRLANISAPIPIFRGLNIPQEENLPLRSFNNSLYQIEADLKTLLKFLKLAYYDIQQLEVVSKVYNLNFADILQRLLILMASLIQGPIDGLTTIVPLKSAMDSNISNAQFNGNVLVFPVTRSQVLKTRYADQDINITVEGKSIKQTELLGNKSDPFNLDDSSMLVVRSVSENFETVKVVIDVATSPLVMNKVRMNFGDELVDTRVSVFGGDVPENRKLLGSTVITDTHVFFSLTESVILSSVRIILESSLGKKHSNNDIVYAFPIKQIVFSQEIVVPELLYISKLINLGKKVSLISIFVDEDVPEEAVSKYYINYSGTLNAGWVEIEPTNRLTKTNNILNLGKLVGRIPELKPLDNSWNIETNSTGDIVLHNILSVDDFIDNPGFQILGSILQSDNGNILPLSIQLFRGINDYAITKTDVFEFLETNEIVYKVTPFISGIGFKPLDLLVIQVDLVRSTNAEPAKINLKNVIDDLTTLEIKDSNGIIIDVEALLTSSTITENGRTFTQVLLNDVLDSTETFTATYEARLKNVEDNLGSGRNIVIDTNSFKVRTTRDVSISIDSGFTYSEDGKKIYLSRKIVDIEGIVVSFNYSIKNTKPIDIYETHIYADNNFILNVIGFTEKELSAGNFHRIDGIDISSITSIDLGPGHHILQTTQPYPTDINNLKDVNALTKEQSIASISIPDGLYYRGFEDSLRLVSQFRLANNVHPNDERSFAFFDNKIWLNREPQLLSQTALANIGINEMKGNGLLGKKVSSTVTHYIAIPETFDLRATVELNKLPTEVRLKIIVDGSNVKLNNELRIREVGINNLTL